MEAELGRGFAVETLDGAKEGVLCSECGLILNEAVQTPDGLRLCLQCYNDVKELPGSKSTKTGISVLGEDGNPSCYPDIAVRREVKKLQVICGNKKFGCDYTGELEKYFKDHIQRCEYKPVPCPNKEKGCLEFVSANEVSKHIAEDCQFRDVQCQHCGKSTAQHLLQEHHDECPEYPLQCPLCDQTVVRDQMVEHEDRVCSKVKCLCGEVLRRDGTGESSVATHLSNPEIILTHLLQGRSYSKSTMDTLLRIETKLKQLDRKVSAKVPKVSVAEEHIKMSQEVRSMIKAVAERVSPLEALQRTMLSSNTKVTGNVELLQRAMDEMDRKFKQQEAQIRALKAKLEQRSVASSWDSGHLTSGGGDLGQSTDRVTSVEKKFEDLERQVASLKVHVSELELQLQASLASTHNGAFLWRIPEIARRKRDAIEERVTSIYSPPFYTGRNGYKMCVRAYLNGDGMGYKTHLSLFFVLMKGEFDPLLKWPFEYKVSLILVDQNHRKHIVQTFKPTVESNSFQRPVTDMNVASGCPQFAKLTALDDDNYVKDDVIFIKCIIDTSKIFHP